MNLERACLELLLRKVWYSDIGDLKTITYRSIDKHKFLKIANSFLEEYTGDEVLQTYCWLSEKLGSGDAQKRGVEGKGIFSYIGEMAERYLELAGGKILCREYDHQDRHSQLLRWRELSLNLGNEMFIAALMAGNQKETEMQIGNYLCTPFPTFSKEYKKKARMEQMAENHFHLKGSFPVFTLNWVCLMNHIGDLQHNFFPNFKRYLEPDSIYEVEGRRLEGLVRISREAAYYRLYLFHKYNGNDYFLESPLFAARELEEEHLGILQDQIQLCRADGVWKKEDGTVCDCVDYAIGDKQKCCNDYPEWSAAGERYFLYRCFLEIYKGKDSRFSEADKNIFYRYLVISMRVRAELVQVNRKRGFSNFAEYQDRKEDFIENYEDYKNQIMNLTVVSLFGIQDLSSMELRITPKSAADTIKKIQEYDQAVILYDKQKPEKELASKEREKQFFYVLHIPKEKDTKSEMLKPRNYRLREKLDRHIYSAFLLLERENIDEKELGMVPRIRAYDTCAGEVGCRPEVFAQFYRQLQAYNQQVKKQQVHFTYHVGEDFLDLFSGLRAIEEAVRFCRLPEGSRIGHGMALGIDAREYYELKKNQSVLPKQDILDNAAWILGFCREHGIVINRFLKNQLEEICLRLLDELYNYGNSDIFCERSDREPVSDPELAAQEAAAAQPKNKKAELNVTKEKTNTKKQAVENQDKEESRDGKDSRKREEACKTYYDSWKLRGDRPEAYLETSEYLGEDFWQSCILAEDEDAVNVREQEPCRNYYQRYHYDEESRMRGERSEIWKTDRDYYELAERIQTELRKLLTEKKIAVECNPSSNYCIGPFTRYDRHPMLRMYGKNLADFPSSRMNISINTDDMGVFHTSLEMEYAIMYTALRKSRNENGELRYSEDEIYQWMEDIRKFGQEQAFE